MVGGSQRLVRVTRQKVGVAHSRAKRAMLIFFCSCAPQKAPKPLESEPHTFRLTSACSASKPQPSLTAFPGQKESFKKKVGPAKKVGVDDSANGPMPGLSPFFFSPSEVPRAGGPNPGPRSPVWDPTRAAGVGVGGSRAEAIPRAGQGVVQGRHAASQVPSLGVIRLCLLQHDGQHVCRGQAAVVFTSIWVLTNTTVCWQVDG